MKYLTLFTFIIILVSGCGSTGGLSTKFQPETTSLDSVLKILTKDYNTALNYLDANNQVSVCQASVTFDVSTTKTAGAGLSVLVFKSGYTQTWNHETTVTYNLERPRIRPNLKPALTNNFQKAIVAAAVQFNSIKDSAYLGGLVGSSFSIEIDFVVTRTGELNISLFDEVAGVNAKYEKDATQKINMLFALPGQCPK
jgi:hypothetical protein